MSDSFPKFVFDLDGTLADCRHRQDLANAGEWDQFNSLCDKDGVWKKTADLFRTLQSDGGRMAIATGRSRQYILKTQNWLADKNLMPDILIMRPENDFRSDFEVKLDLARELYGSLEVAAEHCCCWFDDRERVIVELRNAGITVAEVRESGY